MEYLKFFSMLGMGIYGVYDSCRFAKNENLFPFLKKEALTQTYNNVTGKLTQTYNNIAGKLFKKG